MIKVENIEVWGFEHAIRGMRNPLNSWARSDSAYCYEVECEKCRFHKDGIYCGIDKRMETMVTNFVLGSNDLDLMRRLFKGGAEHRKYLRQIFVSFDLTSSLYFYKEFDTYKIGTTANSTSTMHKIHAKEFTMNDFSTDHMTPATRNFMELVVNYMESVRQRYMNDGKNKEDWYDMIQLLPSSYNQKRTITMNYENVINMIHQRENHKLDEWKEFVEVLKNLPYVKEIIGE